MFCYKLLTDVEMYIDVDPNDGDIYEDVQFMVARVDGSSIEGVNLNVVEARRVAKQLTSFVNRYDKRIATAKARSKKIRTSEK